MSLLPTQPRVFKTAHEVALTKPKPNAEPKAKTMATQGRVAANNQALALAKALTNMKGTP